jgi:hypothetical protein
MRPRHFNQIKFDRSRGTVMKRSQDKQKLIREIQWYLNVPAPMKYKIPRILNYSLDPHDPWVEMQYLSGTALDRALLGSKFDQETWRQLQFSLQTFLKQCVSEASSHAISNYRKFKMMEYIYLRKTFARIRKYEDAFSDFKNDPCVLNGRSCLSLELAQLEILKWFNRLDFQHGFVAGYLHGDLSYGNVLYTPDKLTFHLVDPRGSFGEVGTIGDVRYDMAKILQCCHGKYDFILNDRFELKQTGSNEYWLHVRMTDEQRQICDISTRLLLQGFDVSKADLLFIESLLFLSLIPLHSDKPRSQKAFLLCGLSILSQAIELQKHKAYKEQGGDNHHPPKVAQIRSDAGDHEAEKVA